MKKIRSSVQRNRLASADE